MALVLTVNFLVSTLKAIGKAVFRRNKQKQPLRIQEQIRRRKRTDDADLNSLPFFIGETGNSGDSNSSQRKY